MSASRSPVATAIIVGFLGIAFTVYEHVVTRRAEIVLAAESRALASSSAQLRDLKRQVPQSGGRPAAAGSSSAAEGHGAPAAAAPGAAPPPK